MSNPRELPSPNMNSVKLETLDISVTVQTYNRSSYLHECLLSLIGQKREENLPTFEIIVVDNKSNDNTPQVVKHIQQISTVIDVKYIYEPQQGLSYARNSAIAHSRGKYVAFIDDDGVAKPNWLLELWKAIKDNPKIGCVGGRTLPRWEVAPPNWLDSSFGLYVGFSDLGDTPRFLKGTKMPGGGNIIYRKEALLEVGDFKPGLGRAGDSLMAGEEVDLLLRLQAAGVRILYTPQAVIHHNIPAERMSLEYMRRRGYGVGESLAIIRCRNGGLLCAAIYVPLYYANLCKLILNMLVASRNELHDREATYWVCRKEMVRGYTKHVISECRNLSRQ